MSRKKIRIAVTILTIIAILALPLYGYGATKDTCTKNIKTTAKIGCKHAAPCYLMHPINSKVMKEKIEAKAKAKIKAKVKIKAKAKVKAKTKIKTNTKAKVKTNCTKPKNSIPAIPVISSFPEQKMIPGKRTIKNFLATALAPTGKVLWVTGGGWSYDDTGADEAARSIGLSKEWLNFFNSEDANYNLYDTWPVDGKNIYHEKGLDTIGYIGWVVYNTLFNKSLISDGFVYTPGKLVESLSAYCDFESAKGLSGKTPTEIAKSLKPGDFAIMPGQHMYIVVGSCKDGSLLIVHMAMGDSSTGASGGSTQLSAVSEGAIECEASKLAETYMKKYPEWGKRYSTLIKDIENYMNFYDYAAETEVNGVFHWKENVLRDPEGYLKKSAGEIIAELYK